MLDSAENEKKFHELLADLQAGGVDESSEEFFRNPLPALTKRDITLVPSAVLSPQHDAAIREGAMANGVALPMAAAVAASAGAEGEKAWVVMHWWGPEIFINEKLTQDIITGVQAAGAIEGAIIGALSAAGGIPGAIAGAMGAVVTIVVAAKTFELKVVDNGKGVSFPITWPQWAVIVAALPPSPASIAAAMLVIHPVRQ